MAPHCCHVPQSSFYCQRNPGPCRAGWCLGLHTFSPQCVGRHLGLRPAVCEAKVTQHSRGWLHLLGTWAFGIEGTDVGAVSPSKCLLVPWLCFLHRVRVRVGVLAAVQSRAERRRRLCRPPRGRVQVFWLWYALLEVPGLPQLPADHCCALRSLSTLPGRYFCSGCLLPNDSRAATAQSCGCSALSKWCLCRPLVCFKLGRGLLGVSRDCCVSSPGHTVQPVALTGVEFVRQGFLRACALRRRRRVAVLPRA